MRKVTALLVFCVAALAQTGNNDGLAVSVSGGPHGTDYTRKFFYNGNSDVEYVCTAATKQSEVSWTIALTTLTSIVVSSNTGTVTTSSAHGLAVGNPVYVRGSSTSALNGLYYVQTVPLSTTFTITTSGVSNATYNNSGMAVASDAPRTTASIWKIQKYLYSGTDLIATQTSDWRQICDNRAVTTGATKVTYK